MYYFKSLNFQYFNAIQLILFLSYLFINMLDVGPVGVGVELLAIFILLSFGLVFFEVLIKGVYIKKHFLFFLLFIAWAGLKIVLDVGDVEYLKQMTIATTNGMLLFFMLGTLSRKAINEMSLPTFSASLYKLLILMFFVSSIFLFFSYIKMLPSSEVFYVYIEGGGYQRAGAFFIIYHIIISLIFINLSVLYLNGRFSSFLFWCALYCVGSTSLVVSSQVIGSNAATANVLSIMFLTMTFSAYGCSGNNKIKFFISKVSFFKSKKIHLGMLKCFSLLVFLMLFVSMFIFMFTDVDLNKTRVFGFGNGSVDSLTTRAAIFDELLSAQVGYAPFLGNANVAYLTTGEAGNYVHSFIPNLISELGLVGLIIFSLIVFMIWAGIVNRVNSAQLSAEGFKYCVVHAWIITLFISLFIFANVAVAKDWIVIWFFLGFSVSVINNKRTRKAG